MTLEIALLALEALLLFFTIILLVMSLKEGRGRDQLILEVSKATRTLTRHEYFITVIDAMMDAQKEVVGAITGRMPSSPDDAKRMREVAVNIEKLVASGVKVRYILPKFQDRLHVGWLYTKAGAEVLYSTCPHVHDFRYIVVDERIAVIGLPESTGEREATRAGYRIPSEGLAKILHENFLQCMNDTMTYEQFIRETLKQTGATPATLARELKIDESELARFKADQSA